MRHRVDCGVCTVGVRRFARTHGGGAVDDVGVAASGEDDVAERGRVELAGGVEVEVELVISDGEFEVVVEVVGEIVVGVVEIAEKLEIFLEFGQAWGLDAFVATGETVECFPDCRFGY